jgi:transposase
MYETGAMRRVHLRGTQNILKRLLIHGAAFNLSLILRKQLGAGKPKQLPRLCILILRLLSAVWTALSDRKAAFPNNQTNFASQSALA